MSLAKRAWLHLVRKPGRTVTLLLIVGIMSTLILVGVLVKTRAEDAAQDLRRSIGSSFILRANDTDPANLVTKEENGYTFQVYDGPVIDDELIDRVLGIEGVTNSFVADRKVAWTALELLPATWTDEYAYYQEHPEYLEQHHTSMEEISLFMHALTLQCCNEGDLHDFFRTGALQITDGRNIMPGDVFQAVISEELAKRNNLQVGDTFVVETKEGAYRPAENPLNTLGEPIRLTVVGLFDANFEQEISPETYENAVTDNLVFTDEATAAQIDTNLRANGFRSGGTYASATFFVDDPEKLDEVMEEVSTLPEARGLIRELDDVAYRASVKPLQQMSRLSTLLIVAAVAGVAVVLYLVLRMWTTSRRREIGILFSIGIHRIKVQLQLLLECILISALALVVSFSISSYTVGAFGTFAEQMAAPDAGVEQYSAQIDRYFELDVQQVSAEPVHLDYVLDFQTGALVTTLVLGIAGASVCLAALKTLKMKPKDILTTL